MLVQAPLHWRLVNLLQKRCCKACDKPECNTEYRMRLLIGSTLLVCALLGRSLAMSQVKMTRDQMLFYTSDWKGDRFSDGRPKLPDSLFKRAVDMSIEDIWDFLRANGYQNQFEAGWQALHIEKP